MIDAQVMVSLLYRVSRRPLSVPAALLRRDISNDAELHHETPSCAAS
jgi:hypothetical protein